MRLQLLLTCPECEQKLTPEEMSYGHDCEVFAIAADYLEDQQSRG